MKHSKRKIKEVYKGTIKVLTIKVAFQLFLPRL